MHLLFSSDHMVYLHLFSFLVLAKTPWWHTQSRNKKEPDRMMNNLRNNLDSSNTYDLWVVKWLCSKACESEFDYHPILQWHNWNLNLSAARILKMVIKWLSYNGFENEFSHLWQWQYGTCTICENDSMEHVPSMTMAVWNMYHLWQWQYGTCTIHDKCMKVVYNSCSIYTH
jgi:hypothetical protein